MHFFAPEICLSETCAAPDTSPPPVPAGAGGFLPMRADRSTADGSKISIAWDDQCAPVSTKIVYGPLGQVSDYAICGSACGIANPEARTGVPAGDLWFVVISDDGVSVESSWSQATDGERNGLTHSNTCGATAKEITGTCP